MSFFRCSGVQLNVVCVRLSPLFDDSAVKLLSCDRLDKGCTKVLLSDCVVSRELDRDESSFNSTDVDKLSEGTFIADGHAMSPSDRIGFGELSHLARGSIDTSFSKNAIDSFLGLIYRGPSFGSI